MKIISVQAMRLRPPARPPATPPRRPSWWQEAEVAHPLSRYAKVKRQRGL